MGTIVFAIGRNTQKAPLKWESRTEEPVLPKTKEPDKDAKIVLELLASHEDIITQKELKEALNYSDSKMSLILAELEHEGLIKQFKRGRGNIIKRAEKQQKSF